MPDTDDLLTALRAEHRAVHALLLAEIRCEVRIDPIAPDGRNPVEMRRRGDFRSELVSAHDAVADHLRRDRERDIA